MTNTYTRGLAEYIASSTFEILPQAVVEHVKLLVLDTIGAGLLGAGLPWSERLRATMQATEAAGPAAVWGRVLHSVQRPTTQADVLQKFRKMTAARLSTTAQDDMIALCERLETVEDATILVAMMEPGSHRLA